MSDGTDCCKLHQKLASIIDSMEPNSHPDVLVYIITGRLSSPEVNVYDVVQLGHEKWLPYENSLLKGFQGCLTSKVNYSGYDRNWHL